MGNSLKEKIKKLAGSSGFQLCGISDFEPMDHLRELLILREESGKKTEFETETLELRLDPKLTFPSGRSIIVLGLSYNFEMPRITREMISILSRSSVGLDYHILMRQKMMHLIASLKKEVSFEYYVSVDTGPLLDRELARKAGIGFYGKNCAIINREYGSYIFIGYIMTDLELEPDPVHEDLCGDCDRCLHACPMQALQPFRLDPKRCLSYLTQTKDFLSEEVREKMGRRLYGCDTCQESCPINQHAKKVSIEDLYSEPWIRSIDPRELFSLSNRQFKEHYGQLACSWRGKNILIRNAIINIVNTKRRDYLPDLEALMDSENEMIADYAKWGWNKLREG